MLLKVSIQFQPHHILDEWTGGQRIRRRHVDRCIVVFRSIGESGTGRWRRRFDGGFRRLPSLPRLCRTGSVNQSVFKLSAYISQCRCTASSRAVSSSRRSCWSCWPTTASQAALGPFSATGTAHCTEHCTGLCWQRGRAAGERRAGQLRQPLVLAQPGHLTELD